MNLSKNQVKYIKSLHQSKFRQMYENFIAEGDKLALELLTTGKYKIELIAANSSFLETNSQILKKFTDITYEINDATMAQISNLSTFSNVIVIAKKMLFDAKYLLKNGFSFYLDGVQDPGNVGSIIRIADWFGMSGVIRSASSADFFNPKVVQASMGSICGVGLGEMSIEDLLEMDDNHLVALDMEGVDIETYRFGNKGLIILGNEGLGVNEALLTKAGKSNVLSIKGAKGKTAESLNVAVSAGIVASKIFYST